MNAIILAAGMGTRLRPLTNDIPKCLVKVNGVPMVERQIIYLQEKGIQDITLVSGYKAETLDFLKNKYGVDIVYNERYDSCNNLYSMVKVLERFGDSYVLEGDIYMDDNCIDPNIEKSTYFSVWKDHYENEWGLTVDNRNNLTEIVIGDGKGYIMSGISFWTKKDANRISAEIMRLFQETDYTNIFWDNAVINCHPSMNIVVRSIDSIYEIDTLSDLMAVENKLGIH